jgi:hypothetical protein
MKPESLFYIERVENNVAGPYDLVQMAGLLRKKIITSETSTRLEGEDGWKPFSWQPQFAVAREMPVNAASTRTEDLDELAAARAAGPIPLPSWETLLKLGAFAVAVLVAFAGAYFLAWINPTLGYGLIVVGGGAAIVAQVCIILRVLGEDTWKVGKFYFIPGYDVYYFACNFWRYFPWFCLKYIGAAVWAGAMLGLGRPL